MRYKGFTNKETWEVNQAVRGASPLSGTLLTMHISKEGEFNLSTALIYAIRVVPGQRTEDGTNLHSHKINWSELADFWNKVGAP